MEKKFLNIAIDGPVAAGKGSVAFALAQKYNLLYIDTGAMYRTVAYLVTHNHLNLNNENLILEKLKKTQIKLSKPTAREQDGRFITVQLNNQDISWKIRTEEIGLAASNISTLKKIRQFLVKKQQQIAQNNNIVMEGRDIASKVLPSAQLKIFLTAKQEIRANRRWLQLKNKGKNIIFKQILEQLKQRDYQDVNREESPLLIVKNSIIIDSSNLTIQQIITKIDKKLKRIIKKEKIQIYD